MALGETEAIEAQTNSSVPQTVLDEARRTASGRLPVRDSRAKRLIDVVLSLVMLVVGSPVILVIALAIKLEDGGPALYLQERWGAFGRPFRLRKFRTMAADSDHRFGITQSAEDDERVTRVGKLLRATGLDEFPQLLNILRGDMSFVGPRALACGELVVDPNGDRIAYENVPGFVARLAARPGLTGLATIYLPKDADPMVKFEYDLRYIREWTFTTDLKMIARSFLVSVLGRWETRDPKV